MINHPLGFHRRGVLPDTSFPVSCPTAAKPAKALEEQDSFGFTWVEVEIEMGRLAPLPLPQNVTVYLDMGGINV